MAQSVTVDYSALAGSGSPLVFGADSFPSNGVQAQVLVNNGVTVARGDYYMSRVLPSSTTTAYETALASGCPAGSICDASKWNWNAGSGIPLLQSAHSYGLTTIAIVDYNVAWNSSDGTIYGAPLDWNVYEDIVMKMVQYFAPDLIEIYNEPDAGAFGFYSTSDYTNLYFHAARAIRAVNATVPIGGPATSIPRPDYVTAMLADAQIRPWVNWVSYHSYRGDTGEDGTVMQAAQGLPVHITEWNADGSCTSALDINDPSTVGYVGVRLLTQLAGGFASSALYTSQLNTPCSMWDASGNLYPKMRAYLLLAKQLGLGAGASALKQTSANGVTAVGAINAAGAPVVALANNSAAPATVSVTLQNTGLIGNIGWQTYLADWNANTAQSPAENTSVAAVSGALTHTIMLTPFSTAGVVLGGTIATPTPSETPTASATSTATPTPAGVCAVTITAPVAGATVSGIVPVVINDACPGGIFGFNRLYLNPPADGGSTILWDTTRTADGPFDLGAIAWDSTGLIKEGESPIVSVTIAKSVSTPTPTPTPTATATPMATPTPAGACAVTITAPVAGATVSGTIMVTATDVCRGGHFGFNRLYVNNRTFNGGKSIKWNTTGFLNGKHTLGLIAWDNTGLILEGAAPNVTVTVANGATPTPTPSPLQHGLQTGMPPFGRVGVRSGRSLPR